MLVGRHWLEEDARTLNAENIKRLKERLDFAAANGFSCEVLLSLHYLPGWFWQRHPDAHIADRRNQFLLLVLDHPATRQMVETYFRALLPQIKGHPAICCYSLINEAQYWDCNDYIERSISLSEPGSQNGTRP